MERRENEEVEEEAFFKMRKLDQYLGNEAAQQQKQNEVLLLKHDCVSINLCFFVKWMNKC